MPLAQTELFPLPQGDLFGADAPPAAPAYVVPYQIAVNTLRSTLELLRGSKAWPLDPDMRAARMERTVPKLLGVLPPDEAARWRADLEAEAARLDDAA